MPSLISLNDLRGVVPYLKKNPYGVSIGEASRSIKKQMLDYSKLVSYQALGIINTFGDQLHLSSLGWELARILEAEAQLFRNILYSIKPYKMLLQWAHSQDLEMIVVNKAQTFWEENFPEALDAQNIKAMVVCFFHLCQAAELGIVTIGKRGQPDRLRLDRQELRKYAERWIANPFIEDADVDTACERQEQMKSIKLISPYPTETVQTSTVPPVYISHRQNDDIITYLRMVLELAGLECLVHVRAETDSPLIEDNVLRSLRQCRSGILVLGENDFKPESGAADNPLKESVQIEIGAASVLYNRHIVIMREKQLVLPEYLSSQIQFEYAVGELAWETGVQLVRTLKDFESAGG